MRYICFHFHFKRPACIRFQNMIKRILAEKYIGHLRISYLIGFFFSWFIDIFCGIPMISYAGNEYVEQIMLNCAVILAIFIVSFLFDLGHIDNRKINKRNDSGL